METLNIFDAKFSEIIQKGVKILSLTQSDAIDTIETNILEKTENIASVEDGKKIVTCSHCKVTFEDIFLHRDHFKLDWHRYNLKQSLLGKKCVTEEEFQVKTGEDDLSSISGSDSEEENLDTFVTSQGKIFLQNGDQKVFSLYKCIIFEKKEEISDETIFTRLNDSCVKNKQWTLFMLGGGHFAGAVFQNNNPILHKTFHCYTVRQGQGGSQSSKDNKSGGSHPKSAGASLRRYNEQALAQHVRNIVELWKDDMAKSSLIIFRASGPYNRSVLFGGSNPILEKNDFRLRTIPFATRRATFTEIKRVQGILTTAKIYENLEAAINTLDKTKTGQDSRRPKAKNPNINRSKSREIIERPLPTKISEIEEFSSDSSYDEENLLIASDSEINFKDLQVFDNSFTSKELKKVHRKKKPKKSKAKKLQEKEQFRKDEYKKVLTCGNVVLLKELVDERLRSFEGQETDKNAIKDEFLNEVLDDDGNTPLHLSALSEHLEMTKYLLEQNSDPCFKNKKQLTPYCVTQNKEIREIMKQFARENPEKHNYNKAQIPTHTLTPEQIAERKKTQRKIKKEKDKIKKIENDIKKKEELEQDRFLKLSDREKRALAAERRIIDQSGKIIARCFLCAVDISGKVPFEYMGNRFCTVECLKAHRMQNPIILS